jgi:hypothetical protein
MSSQCQTTPFAISGDPVLPYYAFKKAAPGGISAGFFAALHQPAALCEEVYAYFIPSMRSINLEGILTNQAHFVK